MSDAATWLLTASGVTLTLLSIFETWMAVLYPRAVSGPVTSLLYRAYHNISRSHFASSSRLLLFSGPFLIVSQVVVWATLLLLGVALIVWPQLGTGIISSIGGATDKSVTTAVYYAGYTITTLGNGDLVPRSSYARLVTITAAGIGFSFFTLVLAYVISVYSALVRRNQFASEIHYRIQRSGQSLRYLQPYLDSDDPAAINQDLFSLTSSLADLLESHHFYPALHYFRFHEPRYAMSQMLRFCLEVATILRTCHTQITTAGFGNPEPSERLWHASLQMLQDAKEHFVICRVSSEVVDVQLVERLSRQLQIANRVAFDRDSFVEQYREYCTVWSNDLQSLEHCTMTKRQIDESE